MTKLYRIYGLMPMTKDQIISYLKSSNELTVTNGKFKLTGGIPYEVRKGNKTVRKYKQETYSGYEDYFNKMLNGGFITYAFEPFKTNKVAI